MEIFVSDKKLWAIFRQIDREMFPDRGRLRQSFITDQGIFVPERFSEYLVERRLRWLNNFILRFPKPNNSFISPQRWLYTENGVMDLTFKEDYDNDVQELSSPHREKPGELISTQTHREFLGIVESVIALYQPDLVAVWELRGKWQNGTNIPTMWKYFKSLFPSYIHLRALGYEHRELTS